MAVFRARAAPLGAAFLFAVFVLAGCATREQFGGSRAAVIEWSAPRGFVAGELQAREFRLLALQRGFRAPRAAVYIEGDGAAWSSAFVPPRDPTPDYPLALALAAADPSPLVVYLGRPCQYRRDPVREACDSAYWTDRRFAREVLAAYDDALDQIKARSGATSLALHGYSGGGVLAALLSARRADISQLVTIAAPLSLGAWTAGHGVSPLRGSLDPAIFGDNKPPSHSVHFTGAADRIVPAIVVEDYARRRGGRVRVVQDFDHECCWVRDWVKLLDMANTGGASK